jgi:tetratricopeptide (TPR) repeat protein
MALQEKERGNKLLAEKKTSEAIEAFTRGLALLDGEASSDAATELRGVLLSNRSAAHASLRRWNEALVDAEQAVKLRPTWSKAHARAGLALFQLLRGEDSLSAFKKALELEPSDALRANVKQAQDLVQAIELTVLAEGFAAKQNWVAAEAHFRRSVELASHAQLFWASKSHANTKLGNFADAIADADKAIQLAPDWFRGFHRKAEALYAQRKFDDALQWFGYAVQLAPDVASLKSEFAQCQQEALNARRRAAYEEQIKKAKEDEEKAKQASAGDKK